MAQQNKVKKTRNFRLTLADDKSHKHLWTAHFTKVGFIVTIISAIVMFSAAVYCVIAFTPVRTFIPGYPDAHSKRAAIQNAIKIDSLENVIYRWELYSENLRRVVEGREPLKIDSLINAAQTERTARANDSELAKKDSLLRETVKEEEEFGISARSKRDLPIEGLHFFTPLKGVVSQGYDANIHPYIDVTAPVGSVVKATLDGTVISPGGVKMQETQSRSSTKATSFPYTSTTRNFSRRWERKSQQAPLSPSSETQETTPQELTSTLSSGTKERLWIQLFILNSKKYGEKTYSHPRLHRINRKTGT
jgi:hypothetical protein